VAQAAQLEDLLGFGDLVRVTRKRGRLTVWLPPSGDGRFAVICFTLRMLKASVTVTRVFILK
jgi:hypothetical protein